MYRPIRCGAFSIHRDNRYAAMPWRIYLDSDGAIVAKTVTLTDARRWIKRNWRQMQQAKRI